MTCDRSRHYINESITQARRALEYGKNFGYQGFDAETERESLIQDLRDLLLNCADAIKDVERLSQPQSKSAPKQGAKWSILAR